MSDCLFCRITAGDIPSDRVAESERVIAFRDIAPIAPTHVLIVPKEHHQNVGEVAAADPALLAEMAQLAQQVAEAESGGSFQWIFNTGTEAGQTVFHVHGHVIAGAKVWA